jgi:hypothetical protein
MIGFILHYMGFYNACKILYCINAVIFYVGIMQSYRAFENLGPKLVMIKGMVSFAIDVTISYDSIFLTLLSNGKPGG